MKKIFTFLSFAALATAAHAQIVINEVYGGGGGTTAVYKNDFVELKNIGSTPITLSNATLQYASATGAFNSYITLPNLTLAPGKKYLVEMVPSTPNTVGANLPTADFQATQNISFSNGTTYTGGFNMAAGAGKIALASSATQVVNVTDAFVLDFVGYGTTASLYEGAGAAPAPDATTSVERTGGDTNNNAVDFIKHAPTPENMILATSEVAAGSRTGLILNTLVKDEINFGTKTDIKIFDAAGNLVREARVNADKALDVASLKSGIYTVTGTVNGVEVSQRIMKD